MGIEWGVFPETSTMSMFVHDNTGAPGTVLDASLPFAVHVSWVVPDPINDVIGGEFRVRVYAESIGPGQEQQVGGTLLVPAEANKITYNVHVDVPGDTLAGEGQAFGGHLVSGMYKFVAVLQHMNPFPNQCSGYAEGPLIHLRAP